MEIAAAGVKSTIRGEPWRHDELLTCEQALTALTINCAKQMIIENERGSISVGKYADFLFVDKDVLPRWMKYMLLRSSRLSLREREYFQCKNT